MKPIKIELSAGLQEVELIPISDVHLGDPHCEFERIQENIRCVAERENAYAILCGDLMNTAVKTSVSDTYAETIPPMAQLEQCVKLFSPIASKILAVVPGNHEARIYRTDGVDITELMCTQLGIHDRYSPTTALLFLRFGEHSVGSRHKRKVCYTAYITHGTGGGRREGGKINRLADYATIVDADMYICGHTHLPAVFKESFYRVDTSNSNVALTDKLFVNTSAHLNYGGYGDTAGFKPASLDSPRIILDGHKKQMRAIL